MTPLMTPPTIGEKKGAPMNALRASITSRTGIVLSETFINALLAFLTYAVIVRITDLATVGLWALVSSLMAFARSVDVWSRGVSSFVAQARAVQGDSAAATYVSTAALAGAGGYAVVTLAAAPLLWWGLGLVVDETAEALMIDILPLMLVSFWLNSVGGIYQLGFLGFERPGLKAIQTIGGSLIFLFGTVLLAPHYGLAGMVIAQISQGTAMLLFALLVFHIGMMRGQAFRLFDGGMVHQLASFGSKAIGLGAMQLLTEPILRLIANQFGGLASVGVVDFASRLCQIPRTFIGAIGQTMVPSFARAAHGSEEEQRRLFDQSRALIVPLSATMMASTIGGAYLAGWLFIEQTGIDAALVTTILAIGWLSNLVASTEYFMLFGRRNLKMLTLSHLVMVGGMLALGLVGGVAIGFLGGITGAMAGVVLSSWLLVVLTDRPGRASCGPSRPRFDRTLLLGLLTLLVLTGQLYMVATGILPTWITAGVGTVLIGLIVAILTPWRTLITISGSIDRVASSEAKECNRHS